MKALDSARMALAMRLAPKIDVARGKRTLERVCRDAGVSASVSKRIASQFFQSILNERQS